MIAFNKLLGATQQLALMLSRHCRQMGSGKKLTRLMRVISKAEGISWAGAAWQTASSKAKAPRKMIEKQASDELRLEAETYEAEKLESEYLLPAGKALTGMSAKLCAEKTANLEKVVQSLPCRKARSLK